MMAADIMAGKDKNLITVQEEVEKAIIKLTKKTIK